MTEIADVELVDDPGQELEPMAPPSNLFRTEDPVQVVTRATEAADALKTVLTRQGLTSKIQGRDHVRVEGWLTLAAMLGVSPVCTWTRQMSDPDGWEARVEVHNSQGRVIGGAEAQCDRSENTWAKRDNYAIRSMAQTRASSKALASVLRFVVTLAGYSGTPAEEMPSEGGATETGTRPSGADVPSEKQLKFLGALLAQNGVEPGTVDIVREWGSKNLTGGKEGTCSKAIEAIKNGVDEKRDEAILYLVGKAKAWDLQRGGADPFPITPDSGEFDGGYQDAGE